MKQIYVFGHKNPDTDSVCSAIALAYLKNMQGIPATPKVIGQVNNGTKYVLNYFNTPVPSYLNDVKVQIKDLKSKNIEMEKRVDELTKEVNREMNQREIGKYLIVAEELEWVDNYIGDDKVFYNYDKNLLEELSYKFEDSVFRLINEELLYDNNLHTYPDDLEDGVIV